MDAHIKAVPTPAFVAARAGSQTLLVIGVFKLIKASLFLIAALSVFHIVHRDTDAELRKVLHAFRISGDREFAKDLLIKANLISASRKELIAYLLAFYALLFATEGTGLLLRKRWGEWFTSILTATGIPVEVYEMFHHPNALKFGALVLNILIVWFLVLHLRRSRRPLRPQSLEPAYVEAA